MADYLTVPVNCEAVCSSIDSPTRVIGASARFNDLPFVDANHTAQHPKTPYLSEFASRSPFSESETLPPGIHLHWSLPDALTQGNNVDGNLNFPAVPNRWLVTRTFVKGDNPAECAVKAWIIESDFIEAVTYEELANRKVFTQIPVSPDSDLTELPFMLMGRKIPFESYVPSEIQSIETLTATGYGIEDFAAYYPNCMTVFGFHDDASDLSDFDQKGELNYTVVGWYSDHKQDPVTDKTFQEIKAIYHWDVPGANPDYLFNQSLYSASLSGVKWDSTRDYTIEDDAIDVKVAAGHNSSETLSVLVEAMTPGADHSNADIQTLLNALQQGALSDYIEGDSDRILKLLKSLHEGMFDAKPGGTCYTITAKIDMDPNSTTRYSPVDEIELPSDFIKPLQALNDVQSQYDQAILKCRSCKMQLYQDWAKFQYGERGGLPDSMSHTIADMGEFLQTAGVKSVTDAVAECQSYQQKVASAKHDLEDVIGSAFDILTLPANSYWTPKDPVLMLNSADMVPVKRYGFDRLLDSQSGELKCRSIYQYALALTANSNAVSGSDSVSISADTPGVPLLKWNPNVEISPVLAQLYCESFLLGIPYAKSIQNIMAAIGGDKNPAILDPNFDQVIAAGQNAFLSGNTDPKIQFMQEALPPIESAMTVWQGHNPWLPLITDWWVDYFPLNVIADRGQYDPNWIKNTFDFQHEEDIFALNLNSPVDTIPATYHYSGSTHLTPDASLNLTLQLQKFLDQNPNFPSREVLVSIMNELMDWNILSLSLDGLQEKMQMTEGGLSLGVFDPGATELGAQVAQSIQNALKLTVGDDRADEVDERSPVSYAGFDPLRAGMIQIKNLRIVDVFGQFKNIGNQTQPVMTTYPAKSVTFPEKISSKMRPDSSFFLSPRVLQGARLDFNWLDIEDQRVIRNLNAAQSPILGWMLPNYLDHALMFYDAKGQMLGIMYSQPEEIYWQSAPGNNETITQNFETFLSAATLPQDLKDLMKNVMDSGVEYLNALVKALESNDYTIEPDNFKESTANVGLVGRPLVIARSRITLSIEGDPVVSQSWPEFNNLLTDPTKSRHIGGVENINFPVKVGNTGALNDGLVGFYLGSKNGIHYETFYNLIETALDDKIQAVSDNTVCVNANSSAETIDLLCVMDPRTVIHASMGILPVSQLNIPSDIYAKAEASLELVFLTAPVFKAEYVLSDTTQSAIETQIIPEIPLPKVTENISWSWIEYQQNAWQIINHLSQTDRQDVLAGGKRSLTEGWVTALRHK